MPYFWTDQFDVKIQVHGMLCADAEVTVVEGDPADRRFVARYRRDGRVVAVLGWNMPKQTRLRRQDVVGASVLAGKESHDQHTTNPVFPDARAAKCPFDPPPALQSLQEQAPLVRVLLPDGSTPWLVTRYADQKALLSDPRVSSDVTRPGLPESGARPREASGAPISFILMDDPEHARLRRMVTAPFMIKRVEAMRPRRAEDRRRPDRRDAGRAASRSTSSRRSRCRCRRW